MAEDRNGAAPANGPLHGRWSQPEARYVGAATRAAARARRIAELTGQIRQLDRRLAELDADATSLDDLEARAVQAGERFPSTAGLRDAIQAARRADAELAKAGDALALADRSLEQARAAAATQLDALAAAEELARCPAGAVDDAIDFVNHYRVALSQAVAAVREANTAVAAATRWRPGRQRQEAAPRRAPRNRPGRGARPAPPVARPTSCGGPWAPTWKPCSPASVRSRTSSALPPTSTATSTASATPLVTG
ncbi:MAG: hypothetical protein KY441_09730 [Actinobacteria bacterium]|nr:hypothetical protein [Actinomycetota bacterium]